MLHEYFTSRLPAIIALCEEHKVKKLYAFGSIVDGRFVEGKSDIDLMVELRSRSKEEKAKSLVQLWFGFQDILQCEVDVITPSSVRGKYFKKYLELYKLLVYDYKVSKL